MGNRSPSKTKSKMPLLFSYGTLRDQQVQLSLFGRTLVGWKDQLLGYEKALARVNDPEFARTSGKTHHAILRPARGDGAQVEGMVILNQVGFPPDMIWSPWLSSQLSGRSALTSPSVATAAYIPICVADVVQAGLPDSNTVPS